MSDRNLRDIVEQMSDGVALVDRYGCIRYLNPAAARIVGKPAPEIVGRVLWDVVAEPIGPAFRSVFDRVLAGEEVLVLRSYFSRGRWFEVLARPTSGDQVVLFGRDITERLQAEALRRQTEERFHILVDGVKDYAVIMLDPKGQIATWNRGAQRLYGYRADEIVGKDSFVLYRPEAALHARHNLEAAVANGRHEDEGWRVRNDGSRFFANSVFSLLSDELGEPSGFAVVTRDVTERRRMEQELRTSEERLRLAIDAAEVGTWEYLIPTHRWIAVHNGGAPIPADFLPVLFDPFRRAERSDSNGGQRSFGLGLYITREIVVAHGGTIGVSSSNDAGTTFTVRLPRGVPSSAAPRVEP